jgi:hypothetical protein
LLLGGVSFGQAADILGVTAAAGFAGGSIGMVVALWRDRTFQSLALTLLLVVLTLAGIEALGAAFPNARIWGVPLATALDPYRAIISILYPPSDQLDSIRRTSLVFIPASLAFAAALNVFAVWKLRVWNPGRNEPRELREGEEEAEVVETLIEIEEPELVAVGSVAVNERRVDAVSGARGGSLPEEPAGGTTGLHVPRRTHRRVVRDAQSYRRPWNNPILWRELKTRAYGTKPLIIKGAYVLAFALGVAFFYANPDVEADPWRPARALIPLAILSLILVNAQGVTALTSERDTGALDLLLVTELTPPEFIYGKLYGVLYNTKEMVLLPLLLTAWFAITGKIAIESSIFAMIDFILLVHFSAMLGLHAAITYTNSRVAVAHSLGTIFFLMVGILICAFLIILSDTEFGRQLLSFLIFIGAGSVALYSSLGSKNPSQAIALVALLTPFWSFYCVISLIEHNYLAAFLVSMGIYGFALLAMLIPAVSDFDIALGRTNAIQG